MENGTIPSSLPAAPTSRVLCVDLDGTLLATDLLWESLLALLKRRPWSLVLLPGWLLKGKAYLKHQIAQRVELNPGSLPYRKDVLDFVKRENGSGREIVLATASDGKFARSVAGYLGLFSGVLASDGKINLAGRWKLKALETHIGNKGFDYIGNAKADLPLWRVASQVLLVNPSPRLLRQAQRVGPVRWIFGHREGPRRSLTKALRVDQWVKNVLLFVPLLTSHRLIEGRLVLSSLLAFLAFSFCASGTYIVNDLLDLESDRHHPSKRLRPFAAGGLPISTGVLLALLFLGAGFAIAAVLLPAPFSAALGLYVVITSAYSFYLKRIVAVDVLVLAGLYTLRVLAGGEAVNIPISQWLLAFSLFLFLSLAFVKRYAELSNAHARREALAKGRGYLVQDKELVRSLGPTSGYLSVLVLALYISSREVTALYRHPQVLWLACPLLLYWITRVWLLAHRGEIDEDPVVFTLRDTVSYAVGGVIGLIILAAL